MNAPARFSYTYADRTLASLVPRLAMTLRYGDRAVEVTGLLDTGAAMSVLPYNIGLLLGMKWHEQTVSIPLVGNLGSYEARAVAVLASHPQLTPNGPIQLGFAWTRSVNVPVLFG